MGTHQHMNDNVVDPSDALRDITTATNPDPRTAFLAVVEGGVPRALTLNDQFETVSQFKMNASVPMAIRIHFETAKNLYLYSWFVYRFYPIAEQQALGSLEFALRERLQPLQNSESAMEYRLGLAKLLQRARENGLIRNEAFKSRQHWAIERARDRYRAERYQEMIGGSLAEITLDESNVQPTEDDLNFDWFALFIEYMPKIRNNYAHGSQTLRANVLRTFDIVCDLINQIYRDEQ